MNFKLSICGLELLVLLVQAKRTEKITKMFLDIHSHFQQSTENQVVIKNKFPTEEIGDGFFSVGIHPWYFTQENWKIQWQLLENQAISKNCVAIGECGFDKNISENWHLQTEVFEKHILLSEELKKPLIIHCVKAFSELISLKKKFRPKQAWILHGFNKKQSVATELLKNDIKLSFGKHLLTNENLQEIFRKIDDESYFFETDDADFSVEEIYKKAQILRKEIKICTIFDYLTH